MGRRPGDPTLRHDEAHGLVVSWIANRNAILAMFFGVLTLILHDLWRRGQHTRAGLLAPVAFGLGLLCGEVALCTTAYLFAYSLFVERGPLRRRLLPLIPALLVSLLWRAAYTYLGYGSRGSGLYLDPAQEPLRYLMRMPGRFALLWLGQLKALSSDVSLFLSPTALLVLSLVAAIGVIAFFALIWKVIGHRPEARFFLVGSVLATLPLCAIFPSDRMLLPIGLGLSALQPAGGGRRGEG